MWTELTGSGQRTVTHSCEHGINFSRTILLKRISLLVYYNVFVHSRNLNSKYNTVNMLKTI